jgi:hypothetical protein
MKKDNYQRTLVAILLTWIAVMSGCDSKKTLVAGILEGTISIGPICPVETIPPDPACLPTAETYKAYPVSVFTSDGKTKIAQLMPSLDGSYTSELSAGDYLIVLERAKNNIGGSNLPVMVSITSQDKTLLNINIDTGIR